MPCWGARGHVEPTILVLFQAVRATSFAPVVKQLLARRVHGAVFAQSESALGPCFLPASRQNQMARTVPAD